MAMPPIKQAAAARIAASIQAGCSPLCPCTAATSTGGKVAVGVAVGAGVA